MWNTTWWPLSLLAGARAVPNVAPHSHAPQAASHHAGAPRPAATHHADVAARVAQSLTPLSIPINLTLLPPLQAPCQPRSDLPKRQLDIYRKESRGDLMSPAGGTEHLLNLMNRLHLPPETFVEVGANKGTKMLHILELWDEQWQRILQKLHPSLCKTMGPHWSVHSKCNPTRGNFHYHGIEMRPSNFALLKALRGELAVGAAVSLHHAAASDRPAPPMRVCETKKSADIGDEMMSLGSASDPTAGGQHPAEPTTCTMVNVTTLDHFVETNVRTDLTLIKIDAEGFDGKILMGGMRTLVQRKPAVVIFECCMHWHRSGMPQDPFRGGSGASIPSLAKAAPKWGYDLYLVGGRNLLWLNPAVHSGADLELFGTCSWCDFALFRRTPDVMNVPQQFNLDHKLC